MKYAAYKFFGVWYENAARTLVYSERFFYHGQSIIGKKYKHILNSVESGRYVGRYIFYFKYFKIKYLKCDTSFILF